MFNNLYKNIGGKLKKLATITFFVETIVTLVLGIIFGIEEPVFFLVALLGPFAAWISSWVLYAFGELVEDVHAIRNKEGTTEEVYAKREAEENARIEAREKATYARAMAMMSLSKAENQDIPPVELSDDDFIDVFCPNCKSQLSFLKGETNVTCPECNAELKIK